MKKFCIFLLSVSVITIFTAGCSSKQKASMIQSQRRFAKYIEPQNNINTGAIDLSEGPKLNYDAKFGPQSPSFDIKIVDPYKY